MNVLITGTSSGLGEALADKFIAEGYTVYGLNRTASSNPKVKNIQCNLANLNGIKSALKIGLDEVDSFEYVFLNAGELGRLAPTFELLFEEYERAFNINVFSNKVILDFLIKDKSCTVKNVIGISSGAALKPYYGWSLYCCTKAAFKQLLSTYAVENEDVKFINLAPGIVKTKMQDFIYKHNEKDIPSVKKFKDMYDKMDSPDVVSKKIFYNLEFILQRDSGSYFDMRDVDV